ncbi:MAG TPA: ABC transporter permease, partial [Anaerohalosphaeraceae bacterium]|nr:ABC transporter permease [Anaerohalosphaeraceae bacterium]
IAFLPGCCPNNCLPSAANPDEGLFFNGVQTQLLPADLVDKVNEFPSVKEAAPFLVFRFKDPADGLPFTVGGFDPRNRTAVDSTSCASSDILEGRFLTPEDRRVVMLEEGYARAKNLSAGGSIMIAGHLFTILGVVNPGIRPAKADVYMHIQDAEQVINQRLTSPLDHQFNTLLVETAGAKSQDQAIQAVKQLLPETVVSTYACYRPAAQVMGINEAAVWLLIVVIGLGAVAWATKSQWASIIERRREIGILKALGWTDTVVLGQILTESLVQAVIGGIVGCLAAILILLLVPTASIAGLPLESHWPVLAIVLLSGFLLAVIGALLAGSIPALLAARSRPADALRTF